MYTAWYLFAGRQGGWKGQPSSSPMLRRLYQSAAERAFPPPQEGASSVFVEVMKDRTANILSKSIAKKTISIRQHIINMHLIVES
jgi:hypothetical protein